MTHLQPRQYTGRVIEIYDLSPDTRKITIEIEHKQKLNFTAGQYAHLSFPGFEERPYSIASSPHETQLEFHIKNTGRGISAHISENLILGNTIQITAPFGKTYWQKTDRPILLLAGGVGITPIKSMLDYALHSKTSAPLHLYWGARFLNQLYLDSYFRELTKKHGHFSYIPTISDEPLEENDTTLYRKGFTGEAAFQDFQDFSDMSIYITGPKAMIEATIPLLLQKNAEEDYIFSDHFGV